MLDVFRTADHAGQIFIPHLRHMITWSKVHHQNFRTPCKLFPILAFPRKISDFHSPTISDDLWILISPIFAKQYISSEFWIPLFSLNSTFPPISGTSLFPLYLLKFPHDFVKFSCFLLTLRVFRYPLVWPWCIYASHNARRLLGASDSVLYRSTRFLTAVHSL